MRKSNKKGFTIVELVIVIAVIAILAAVLIPTFVSLTRKANIANDTAVAKNLNTAAVSAQAEDFDAALAAVKEAGYLVANLNSKASDCFFVWEDDTNQFLLYDLKAKKILYSNTDVTGDPDESWCFAVNNTADETDVKAAWANVTIKKLIVDAKDIADVLSQGGTVYMDESIVLTKDNLLHFDAAGKTTVVNLENSALNTSGIISVEGQTIVPIEVKQGDVTLKGGDIITAGAGTNYHGQEIKIAVRTRKDTTVKFDGNTFANDANQGQIKIGGTAVMDNVTINSTKYGVETFFNGQLTLKNTTINAGGFGIAVWACNFDHEKFEGDKGHAGNATVTIESGTYTGTGTEGSYASYALLTSCGGDIVITGGTFSAADDDYFAIVGSQSAGSANEVAEIIIKGGTFGEKTFGEEGFDAAYLQTLCVNGTVTANADGTFTITQ